MNYIYLNDQEVWFNEKQNQETVWLKFDKLSFFQTKFSEIVYCDQRRTKNDKVLNTSSNKKKRREIKEFSKIHIKLLRDYQAPLLASA
jgi:hypothetical protein